MRRRWTLAAAVAALLTIGTTAPADGEVASGWQSDFAADGVADLVVGSPGDSDCGVEAGAVNVIQGTTGGLTSTGAERVASCGFRDGFATALAAGDFDGDGLGDLAIGVPFGDGPRGPRVELRYGSASGLVAGPAIRAAAALPSPADSPFGFGLSVSAGDFDGDGADDLVVGDPELGVEGADRAGGVLVVEGSPDGLRVGSASWITQATPGVAANPKAEARFGEVVEARGDYDGDGTDDLAVGVPGRNVRGAVGAGAVHLFYGAPRRGLDRGTDRLWNQRSPGVPDGPEPGDGAGLELVKGDVDADGRDDLAIGFPAEDHSGHPNAGAVLVLPGSAAGVTGEGSRRWTQRSAGVPTAPNDFSAFGHTLAAANFGRGRPTDLAIGVRDGDPGDDVDREAVVVVYGTAVGLTGDSAQRWDRTTPGLPGNPTLDSYFGEELAAANYGNRSYADLAIGVPGAGGRDAGEVRVVYGSPDGLVVTGAEAWNLRTPGIPGEPGGGFRCCFGFSLL